MACPRPSYLSPAECGLLNQCSRHHIGQDDLAGPARQNTGTCGYAHAGSYFDYPFRSEDHIDARAELDQSDSFTGLHAVADFLIADDPARNQTCNPAETTSRKICRC